MGKQVSAFTTLSISTQAELPKALTEAAAITRSRVLPLQEEAKKVWDHIRVEIWEDSGRVIIFPASSKSEKRIDVTGVQIICSELAQRIDALSKSEIGDDDYDDTIKKEVTVLATTVRDSLSENLHHPFRIYDSSENQK